MSDSQILINSGYMSWEQIEKANLALLEKRLGLEEIHQRLTNLEIDNDAIKTLQKDVEELKANQSDSLESQIEDLEEQLQYKKNLLALRDKND